MGGQHIVRLKTDELFYDLAMLRDQIQAHQIGGYAATFNRHTLDAAAAEVYSVDALRAMWDQYGKRADEERGNLITQEQGTDNIMPPPSKFADRTKYPMELDTPADLRKIRAVLGALGPYPSVGAVLSLLRADPALNAMNAPDWKGLGA